METVYLRQYHYAFMDPKTFRPNFVKNIVCDLPGIDPTSLSCDQKYFLDISTTIGSDVCSSDLATCQPGTLNLARSLTTANRILRLYISTSDPSNELATLVVFILRVYAPLWLRIKVHHSIKDGATQLWHFISSSRYLPKKYRDIIERIISRNAYFAAPENMLLAMLTDERCHIRTLAARRIIKAREIDPDGNCVRRFVIPAVYLDWQACNVTPPPVLRQISSPELLKMIHDDMPMDGSEFIKFPSHTQAVERIVKLVTEASRKKSWTAEQGRIYQSYTRIQKKKCHNLSSKKDYKK
ncbi:hypothetical protein AVEN_275072-1 [Araneus ventricosus]|uniref:Uncharacterized protein n=1 Tax=Araneus ventricosus TaxID=182803 RepID=A0A4Y2R7P8_ARAVE|nr:hypothetical protein AVEN_275072-1 [Araneus ventricosus]